jgi:hypothetical protein
MLLQLAAAVRPTETWTPFHVVSVLVVVLVVVWIVRLIRVGGSK